MAKAKKLPSGNYRVQAKSGGVTKSFTGPNKKLVEAEAKKWQAGLSSQVSEVITLEKAYERYISAKEEVLSPSTIRAYRSMTKTNFKELMPLKIDCITDEQIQRAVNFLAATTTPKTVRNNYGLLTAVLEMFNPYYKPRARLPQKVKNEIYVPTKDDILKLLSITQGTKYYTAILLAAFCGMREGEICALTSDDVCGNKITINKSMVRFSNGEWGTKPPKSFSGNRTTEAPDIVIEAIKDINGRLVDCTPHSLSNGFRRILSKNNFPKFRFHDLRHFYISELFDLGLPEKYIIAQVGHSSSNITKAVYDHVSKAKQSAYAQNIAAHFSTFLE